MDEERASYAEDFGLMFEGFGLTRMVGRVLGVLLISEDSELSAEELADALQASRGSISSATRTLVTMGLVQRRTKRGERRDYFRMKPGAWDELMRHELESLSRFRRMAERGLDIASSNGADARRNLEEMRDFYAYWEKKLPAVLDQWKEDKKKEDLWVR
ncbi:MAG: GbsR/MarR family transcriptional regulator [Rubrobacteraceae bacterium]